MRIKKTKTLIQKMLKENTGIHMLDSGSAYGRHWQQNQSVKNWDKIPEIEYEIEDDGTVYYTISVYHYLINNLEEELDEVCQEFNKLQDNDKNDDFAEDSNNALYGITVDGWKYLRDKLDKLPLNWVNTYNYDSNLSQILQYVIVTIKDKKYVLLQIHGGCDARGGYTLAKLIPINDDDYFGIERVYGYINGKPVSNIYDGISLRYDDNVGDDYKPFKWLINKPAYCDPKVKNHKIELFLDID